MGLQIETFRITSCQRDGERTKPWVLMASESGTVSPRGHWWLALWPDAEKEKYADLSCSYVLNTQRPGFP